MATVVSQWLKISCWYRAQENFFTKSVFNNSIFLFPFFHSPLFFSQSYCWINHHLHFRVLKTRVILILSHLLIRTPFLQKKKKTEKTVIFQIHLTIFLINILKTYRKNRTQEPMRTQDSISTHEYPGLYGDPGPYEAPWLYENLGPHGDLGPRLPAFLRWKFYVTDFLFVQKFHA